MTMIKESNFFLELNILFIDLSSNKKPAFMTEWPVTLLAPLQLKRPNVVEGLSHPYDYFILQKYISIRITCYEIL